MSQTIKKLTRSIVVTPVLTGSGAYSAGQNVGGLLTLSNALESPSGTATVMSLTASDSSNQKAQLTAVIFGAKPAATFTDQSTTAISAADCLLVTNIISLPAANYTSFNSATALGSVNNLVAKVKAAKSNLQGLAGATNFVATTLWVALFTSGTPTYATVNALQLTFHLEQDG